MIQNYNDFVVALLECGFSMGGGNNDGVYAVIPWGWQAPPPYDTPVRWHTGDPETDPWEWRMRVLDERKDIAYSKLFFNKSGYITREWYPCFLAARRGVLTADEAYYDGTLGQYAKRIYDLIQDNGTLPVHAIKQLGGFSKEDKSPFERGLVELQMKLLITTCGRQQKVSEAGEAYGWSSTVFCTTEQFWGDEVFREAADIGQDAAIERIMAQIYCLNPDAQQKRAMKFIKGN